MGCRCGRGSSQDGDAGRTPQLGWTSYLKVVVNTFNQTLKVQPQAQRGWTCVRQSFDCMRPPAASPMYSLVLLFFLFLNDSKWKLDTAGDHVTAQITLQCDFHTLKITLLWSSDVQILYPWLCRCCCAICVGSDRVSIRTTFDHVVEDCWVLRRHRAFTLSLFAVFLWLKKSDAAYNITWVQNKGSHLTTTTAELYQFLIKYRDIEL